jgi:glycosyltransferase involved in cell wall biosynthesis
VSLFLVDAGREWRESQNQMLYVARELRKKGYTAHLVLEPGSDILRRAAEEGLPTIALPMHGRMGWLVRKNLARQMRDLGCRLVHVHESFGAALGLAAAAAAQVPVRILSRPADSSPLEGRLPFPSIDAVIAGTEAVKSILLRGGVAGERIEVIPPGTDFSRFISQPSDDFVRRELGLGPDDFLVGVVIPLEDERGHEALFDAAALVAGQAPKIRFIVLGEGSLRLEAPEPRASSPMNSVFYLLGFRKDTPRVLASLNMFTVFSHLDGLGSFLVEAMAAGLAVAAADVGTARDLITHRENGLLVPARNSQALADAVLKVHFDRNLAARLSARGRESVLERYSAEAMARKIIGIYEYRAHRKGLKLA